MAKILARTDRGPSILGQRVEVSSKACRWADQVGPVVLAIAAGPVAQLVVAQHRWRVEAVRLQVLMDMLLMDKFDPVLGERIDPQTSDALRALGLTDHEIHRTSPEVPQMLLSFCG